MRGRTAASLYVEMMTLTLSIVREKDWYRSSFETWSSSRARSTLLMMTIGLIRSVRAWRSTVSVWTQTPSTQSTTTSAPSVTRRAAVTSEEKSTARISDLSHALATCRDQESLRGVRTPKGNSKADR